MLYGGGGWTELSHGSHPVGRVPFANFILQMPAVNSTGLSNILFKKKIITIMGSVAFSASWKKGQNNLQPGTWQTCTAHLRGRYLYLSILYPFYLRAHVRYFPRRAWLVYLPDSGEGRWR